MITKEIIEFELSGTVPLGHTSTVTSKTGYFCDKTKSPRQIFKGVYYLLQKILQEATNLASPSMIWGF